LGKRGFRRKIQSYLERIGEHEQKIREERARAYPNLGRISHWETEINAFREGIRKAQKRLRR
jgi:L-ribulose-5-phosphate 3-epimerase UlaE